MTLLHLHVVKRNFIFNINKTNQTQNILPILSN